MVLDLALTLALAQRCAPSVAPETLLSVVAVESRFEPLTIGVNGRPHRALHPASREDAVRTATTLLQAGANLDLGLAQINTTTLRRLGISVADAFDPCRNLAAEAQVLSSDYLAGAPTGAPEQAALRTAFSLYNTGDRQRGFTNGYVAKVSTAAREIVPAIQVATAAPATTPEETGAVELQPSRDHKPPSPATLDVFARSDPVLVWSTPPTAPPASAAPASTTPSEGDPQ